MRDDVKASFKAHPRMVKPFVDHALVLIEPETPLGHAALSRAVDCDGLCEALDQGSDALCAEAKTWLVAHNCFASAQATEADVATILAAEEAESDGPDTDVLEEKLWDLPSAWLCDLATDVSKDEPDSGVRTLCLAATLCLKKRPKIEVLSEALYQGGVPFRKRVKTWVDEHQLPREDGDQ